MLIKCDQCESCYLFKDGLCKPEINDEKKCKNYENSDSYAEMTQFDDYDILLEKGESNNGE